MGANNPSNLNWDVEYCLGLFFLLYFKLILVRIMQDNCYLHDKWKTVESCRPAGAEKAHWQFSISFKIMYQCKWWFSLADLLNIFRNQLDSVWGKKKYKESHCPDTHLSRHSFHFTIEFIKPTSGFILLNSVTITEIKLKELNWLWDINCSKRIHSAMVLIVWSFTAAEPG